MDIQNKQVFIKKTTEDVKREACILLDQGIQLLSKLVPIDIKPEDIFKEEYCVGSTLYRGYYNPSPVYDIIVGNTSRGRISKKPSSEKLTHHYYLNQANELIQVDSTYQGRHSYTEWFYRENGIRYGLTVNRDMQLSAVSKEIYQDGRLITFALVHCIYKGNKYELHKYNEEQYVYDEEGLRFCNFIHIMNHCDYLVNKVYKFKRENGFLTSYSVDNGNINNDEVSYIIRKKRRAT